MTVTQAMQAIESPKFSAITNLASNLKTFLRIVSSQPEVKLLAGQMKVPDVARAVTDRSLCLLGTPAENGVEHAADAAVAAYLWLLSDSDQYSEIVAEMVAEMATERHFWWARKVAKHVRRPSSFSSGAKSIFTVVVGEEGVDYTAHARRNSYTIPAQPPMKIVYHGSGDSSRFFNPTSRNRLAGILGEVSHGAAHLDYCVSPVNNG